MIAKAIPMAKPQPIWKMLPNAAAPRGLAALMVKVVMAAIPGKLRWPQFMHVLLEMYQDGKNLHVEEDARGFGHAFSQPTRPASYLAIIISRKRSESKYLACSKSSFL